MKINFLSAVTFKPKYNNNENSVKINSREAREQYNNSKLISYPSGYYVSFGKNKEMNKDLFIQMRKAKKNEELRELYEKLTPKARENCELTAKRFEKEGLTKTGYLKACVKLPTLFYQTPDKTENNVREITKRFKTEGLTTEDYLKACLKNPSLFSQAPDTIEYNVREIPKRFEKEDLTTEKYLKACLKQPVLFYKLPDTTENIVREVPKRFTNEGLTLKNYLKACIKEPTLFYKSPDSSENCVREVVKRFKNEGLTTENYLKACVKTPSLFRQSPDTIEYNVREIPKRFGNEGLTQGDYLKACLKQSPLFVQSPDTITEHINVMKFSNLNSKKPLNNDKFWQKRLSNPVEFSYSSTNLMTRGLIIPKMFENSEIPKELKGNGLPGKLKKYLEVHPDKKFTLNVKGKDEDVELLKKCLNEITDENNAQFEINHLK